MGNVGKPEGKEGEKTLERMNKDHTSVSYWAMSHFDIREDDVILDVGCGGGINVKRLHQKSSKAKTYGVDYSKTSVSMSKKLNQESVDKGEVIIEEANVQNLPFDDEIFDWVTAFETVYFWPDIVDSFKEVKRVLTEGGSFVIVLTANGYHDERLVQISREENCKFYTDIELREYLEEAGFSSMDIYIRKLEESKELIKRVNKGNCSEELVEDTFCDENWDDDHHDSPEWVCVVAKK
ncbi:MAG: class I SAM-dependent methyltransferase [Methanosphaera sp.]|nr:class I SAM-dependent methyltransferase [Methanosphaera sp.]